MVKKILPYILCLILGAVLSLLLTQGSYNRKVELLSKRVAEGERVNTELRAANSRLIDENRRATAEATRLTEIAGSLGRTVEELRNQNRESSAVIARLRANNTESQNQLREYRAGLEAVGGELREGTQTLLTTIEGLGELKALIESLP